MRGYVKQMLNYSYIVTLVIEVYIRNSTITNKSIIESSLISYSYITTNRIAKISKL